MGHEVDLGDSLRRVSVSGESADKVEALSTLLEKDFHRYSTAVGGLKFPSCSRDMPFDVVFNITYDRQRVLLEQSKPHRVGHSDCSAVGFLLVLLVPWNRFLAGFVLYQRYSPFFFIRHASQIFVLCLVAAVFGIPLCYFLSRKQR